MGEDEDVRVWDWDSDNNTWKQRGLSITTDLPYDPNSVLLEPGKTGEVIWTFSEATEVGFACNVPGHRNAGMVGKVVFQ